MNRLFGIIIFCLLISRPDPFFGKEINLVFCQRQEAARRKTAAPARLSVDDSNMNALALPGAKYHFTQLVVDPPVNWDSGSGTLFAPESHRVYRIRTERELEEKISEAQANLERYERQFLTVEMDVAPYRIWDKPGYIREREAELQRWIEGERLYIYYTKKRLADLR